ncbi:glucosaminidase domain-containing protein [Sulfurimonas sp.]|uniref:glucosaminidase domain-containing protein n=1 Tax=Sulfurimonas sp. TaxID=2022749 RepID=UPI0035667547
MLKLVLLLGLVFPLFASQTPAKLKKQNFYKRVVPAVNKVYAELDYRYKTLKTNIDNNNTKSSFVKKYMKKYSAKDYKELLRKVKPHPKSIAIAQAAVESGWGTSRFTKVANNLFGVWSFNKNEPRVRALQTRGEKKIFVKKYATLEDSIRDYYFVLATSRSFGEFRKLKMKTNDPYELVKKLDMYSEKRAEYGKELIRVIKFNKLYNY